MTKALWCAIILISNCNLFMSTFLLHKINEGTYRTLVRAKCTRLMPLDCVYRFPCFSELSDGQF